MINSRMILILYIFIFGIMCSESVMADEIISIDDFDMHKSREILNEGGYSEIDYNQIIDKLSKGQVLDVGKDVVKIIYDKTIGDVTSVEKIIGNLLLILITSAFFTNFSNVFSRENVSDTAFYICYLVAITLMTTVFDGVCSLTVNFLKLLLGFVGAIIPTYFLAVAIMGKVTAVGFYQLTLIVIVASEFIFLKIIIPLIKVYVAVSLINNISQEDFLSRTTIMLKNFVRFISKTLVSLITGINIIQGMILPSIDGVKNTTIRKMVGALPVVGDGTDAMTGIVFGSVNLIKNTIGTVGIIIIILLCLVPFIKIQVYSASLQILSAITQPVTDKRITSSLECLCDGTKMLSRVIVSSSLLFIICIAIVCISTNIQR